MDGAPVAWGAIDFHGPVNEKTQQAAQASLLIREGQFASAGRSTPGAGPNRLLVTIFEGEPPAPDVIDSGSFSTNPIGYYATEKTIASGDELKIEFRKADIQKEPPAE